MSRSSSTPPWSGVSTAIVTGAASGMGRLLAERLAGRGVHVHALDRDAEGLTALADGTGGIEPHPVDVTAAEGLEAVLKPLAPTTDLLVTAAAVGHTGRLEETAVSTFSRLITINYLGTVNTVAAILPAMTQRRRGRIVIFASMAGWVPAAGVGPYCATKSAVLTYAEVLRDETAASGIKVTCVCPPAVDTPLLDAMPEFKSGSSRLAKPLSAATVIDAIEEAVSRDRFWVFPDSLSKVLWRARRFTPGLLQAAMTRMRTG